MRETRGYSAAQYVDDNGFCMAWVVRCCTKQASTRVDEEAAEQARYHQARIKNKGIVLGKVAGPSSFTGGSASRYLTPTNSDRTVQRVDKAGSQPTTEKIVPQADESQAATIDRSERQLHSKYNDSAP